MQAYETQFNLSSANLSQLLYSYEQGKYSQFGGAGWQTSSFKISYSNYNWGTQEISTSATANRTWSHDLIYDYAPNGNPFSVWDAPPYAGMGTSATQTMYNDFSNDTFVGVYYNPATYKEIYNLSYLDAGGFIEGMMYLGTANSGFNGLPGISRYYPMFTLNVTHVTFVNRMMGGGTGGEAFLFGQRGSWTVSRYSYDLFENEPYNSTEPIKWYYDPLIFEDLSFSGGTNYINNSYFLNLNNQTLPIQGAEIAGYNAYAPHIFLSGDRFFYSPITSGGQMTVNPYGDTLKSWNVSNSYIDPYSGLPTESTLTYELPIGWNASLSVGQSPQLVSNTSLLQTTPPKGYHGGGNSPTESDFYNTSWSWAITPDVNTLSGTPTISYSNGLVGGPQPNFTWDGYKYTESVEPTYIQVGVNSANAPPVNLQFNGAPNTAYSVAMYDHGQLIDYTNVTSSANGVVTFTYNPATMPLDPVFELTTISASIPPSTPVSNTFLYLEIGLIVLIGVGVVIPLIIRRQNR